jgi:hypothetical protein
MGIYLPGYTQINSQNIDTIKLSAGVLYKSGFKLALGDI